MKSPTQFGVLATAVLGSAIFTAPVSCFGGRNPTLTTSHLPGRDPTLTTSHLPGRNPTLTTSHLPGRDPTLTTSHLTVITTTVSPADPRPTVAFRLPGVIDSCAKYHYIAAGDSCASIAGANGLTLAEFAEWNGLAKASCTDNLLLGYLACVGVY
ncbi:hypothetical protein QBC42DRAFT_285259 [Cladorrhinum samala]|uniref:LysM domain-containing protein n=1 Tax=Cladorrhinum samala TaxID=585594 RepID=A0AAV9HVA4_9PEZI|nr:hypothetical protein QBC42DRAFT_285259 [Cladorrhinum samala]